MKKKSIIVTILLAAVLLLSVPSRAQVFIMEDDEGSSRLSTGSNLPGIPTLDIGYDQYDDPTNPPYAPLGGGAIVLGLFGGAYLLGKRKKDNVTRSHEHGMATKNKQRKQQKHIS